MADLTGKLVLATFDRELEGWTELVLLNELEGAIEYRDGIYNYLLPNTPKVVEKLNYIISLCPKAYYAIMDQNQKKIIEARVKVKGKLKTTHEISEISRYFQVVDVK